MLPPTIHPVPPVPAPVVHTICRSCGEALETILSLGTLALSDFPHAPDTRAHPPVPLTLARCTSQHCGMVQLTHTTPSEWLYSHYWYRSGVNESMVAELKDIVVQALARVELPKHAVVMDIGANDGTLLTQYRLVHPDKTVIRVAYEPARNLYDTLRPHAEVLFPTYFHATSRHAEGLPPSARAKIITAIAMFYDLEAPHTFLHDVTRVLATDGLLVIQQAYLPAMLVQTAYDNICHEHLAYHSLASLEALLEPHGLEVVDVDVRNINGGSFRTYIQYRGQGTVSPRVVEMRAQETTLFSVDQVLFSRFRDRVETSRAKLLEVLDVYHRAGAQVDLLAASTKGNTLLQYCGIDSSLVRQAWERSPEKWGRYVGVSQIPIVSEAVGREHPPTALLATAWQFRQGLVEREASYLGAGGRIIFPLPKVEVVASEKAHL